LRNAQHFNTVIRAIERHEKTRKHRTAAWIEIVDAPSREAP
jgi:hypothetical protein